MSGELLVSVGDAPASHRGGRWQAVVAKLRAHLRSRLPHVRRTLPRDMAILLVLYLLSRQVSVAWVLTDSVYTQAALILKGVPPRQGELAAFAYTGGSLSNYYADNTVTQALRALGLSPRLDGPAKGDGFIKYLIGVPGDRIEVEGRSVFLVTPTGRKFAGLVKTHSKHGVPLTPIKPQTIPEGYVYMMAPHLDALDSRYALMGLVPATSIAGKGVALW